MAKLKLDLHPIFSDGTAIESALENVLREAETKGIPEIEIIPGKGSGALKKTVIRFLNRPDVRSRYHRMVKDGDNWGRLFVYLRPDRQHPTDAPAPAPGKYTCFCCQASNDVAMDDLEAGPVIATCPACGSPNRVRLRAARVTAEPGY